MRKLASLLSVILVFVCGTSAWADLYSGSISTQTLFDSSVYAGATPPPLAERTPVANPPGGAVATAAWDSYGMRLNWNVTQNADNTYTYHYYFGPGWYPASNPTSGSGLEPYVTNKNITAFDIQLGSAMTMADIINPTWNAYRFDGIKIGSGNATSWAKYNSSGAVTSTGAATMLAIGELVGETGYTDQDTGDEYYITNELFHGLQWLNPTSGGNFIFANDVNFDLTFTTTYAPGWGNVFTNSTRTGTNNNNSDVVFFNSSRTDYDPSKLDGPIVYNNGVAVAGGIQPAPVPLPASVVLFGSGLGGLAVFRRKKVPC